MPRTPRRRGGPGLPERTLGDQVMENLSQGLEEATPKAIVKEDVSLESPVISHFLMAGCLPGSKTVQT